MKLYIKQIMIEKNGKITESLEFNKGLSVVKGSAEIYDIIKLLLGIKEAARSFYNIRFFFLPFLFFAHLNKFSLLFQ